MSAIPKWNPHGSTSSRFQEYLKLPDVPVRSAFDARWCKEEDDKRHKYRLTEIDKKNIVLKQVLDQERHVNDLYYEDQDKQRKHEEHSEIRKYDDREKERKHEAEMMEERKKILQMKMELEKLKRQTEERSENREFENREKQRKHEAEMMEGRKKILKMIIELEKLKRQTGTRSNEPESAQDYSSAGSDSTFDQQFVIRRRVSTWACTPHVTEVDEEEEMENALWN